MSVCLVEISAQGPDEPDLELMANDYGLESLWLTDGDGNAVYFSLRQGRVLTRALLEIYGARSVNMEPK
jgi:hypothetical protein